MARTRTKAKIRKFAPWLPIAAVGVIGILAATGMSLIPSAVGATTGDVTVTAIVQPNMSIDTTTNCAGNLDTVPGEELQPVVSSLVVSNDCDVTFGSTNDADLKVTVAEQGGATGNFFEGGSGDIADVAAGTCVDMSAGTANRAGIGVQASTLTAGVTDVLDGGAGCNAEDPDGAGPLGPSFYSMPDSGSPEDICEGAGEPFSTTAYTCTVNWGVEQDATGDPTGTYIGTARFTVVDV